MHMSMMFELPAWKENDYIQHELDLWIYYMSKFLIYSKLTIMINLRHLSRLKLTLTLTLSLSLTLILIVTLTLSLTLTLILILTLTLNVIGVQNLLEPAARHKGAIKN